MTEPDLFTRAIARPSDPHTSHEAAASVRNIRQSQRWVLNTLRQRGPSTDEEILAHLHWSGIKITSSGARTRRSELVALGLVEPSGGFAKTAAGRRSIKWRAR